MTSPILLAPHLKDLGGGFFVRRLLPAADQRAVGPFIFFDHFGPVTATPADNHDVRPHPHIGLATVTYLFEGAMMHRDSTGIAQRIEPGAINWMTAGRGIVHSERTPEDLRQVMRTSHGLQLWAGLPQADEEIEPSFSHTPAAGIPQAERDGVALRVLIGEAFGLQSPVPVRSPTVYVDIALQPGASLSLDVQAEERAIYIVEGGDVQLAGAAVPAHHMLVLAPGSTPLLQAGQGARLVLIGGAALGPRFMWWNFVSSSRERIAQAADAWEADAMGQVPGETERIPLPERRF
jgi:redox-sensitive bicupin YhaK (pirin superfamily)